MSDLLHAVSRIDGFCLRLRLVQPDDGEYIHGLRTNPCYNTYLSPVTGTAADQRQWIEDYKQREAQGREYYYVIERRANNNRCGVVRLYDIAGDRLTWGSWVLDHNKTKMGALESAFLSFDIAFMRLSKKAADLNVMRDNERAINFYKRLQMTEIGRDDLELHFVYTANKFEEDRERITGILQKQVET